MVRTVAVLSDIHGVLPVLEQVMLEPDVQNADLIVATGDHASGPQPGAVLDRLLAEGDRLLMVRGNADRELVQLSRGRPVGPTDPISSWAARQLSADQVQLLEQLPHPLVVEVESFGPVVFCHGSPRRDDEVLLVDSSLPRWSAVLGDLPEDHRLIVCGHTHMPFIRLVDRRMVLNAGSIGMPYGRPGGSWAYLDRGQVSLRHTAIDVDQTIAEVVADSRYPERRSWAEEYVRAVSSDADALEAFTPIQDRRARNRPAQRRSRLVRATRTKRRGPR